MELVIAWLKNKIRRSPSLFYQTRWNLALWYTAVMSLIILVAATSYYLITVQQQYAEVDRDLSTLSQTLIAGIEVKDRDEDDQQSIQLHLDHVPFLGEESRVTSFPQGYIRWYNGQGQVKQQVGTPPPDHPLQEGFASWQAYREQTTALRDSGRTLGYLQVGFSLDPLEADLQQVRMTLGLGIPLVLLFVGVAGWVLAGIAMVPIERSYAQLQQFTADASHELRTPLAALQANAQIALRQPVLSESEAREKLEVIYRTSQRMSALVADLLFLARADLRATVPESARCDLAEILRDLCEELAPLALNRSIDLSFSGSAEPVILSANINEIYRLFSNLITNAIKYTPSEGKVMVKLGIMGEETAVSVEDTGIGIPLEHQAHIFERFYRVDSDRSREVGGSGLGLAICRAIAQRHGGSVTLTRSSTTGSVFTVLLPTIRPNAEDLKLTAQGDLRS